MNWKEQFDTESTYFPTSMGGNDFIPTGKAKRLTSEIVKKLIEDYDKLIWDNYMDTDLGDMKAKLKQQLRDKYLNQ